MYLEVAVSTTNTVRKPGRSRVRMASSPGRNREASQAASDMLEMDLPPLDAGLRAMQEGQPVRAALAKSEEGFSPQYLEDIIAPAGGQVKRPFWGIQEVIGVAVSIAVGIPLGIWIAHWIHALPG